MGYGEREEQEDDESWRQWQQWQQEKLEQREWQQEELEQRSLYLPNAKEAAVAVEFMQSIDRLSRPQSIDRFGNNIRIPTKG
jgi:hypothetical protein